MKCSLTQVSHLQFSDPHSSFILIFISTRYSDNITCLSSHMQVFSPPPFENNGGKKERCNSPYCAVCGKVAEAQQIKNKEAGPMTIVLGYFLTVLWSDLIKNHGNIIFNIFLFMIIYKRMTCYNTSLTLFLNLILLLINQCKF